jgi:hypothetical protein
LQVRYEIAPRRSATTATVEVAIQWFPRRELENFAERLKKAHREL